MAAVEPMMDPPSDDDAPAQTFHPYWDYGPSETHTKSIKLLSEAEVRGLGGGESLVTHWKALMTHIETNSAPVLTRISADTAVQYAPLDEYTRQWKFVQEGIAIFIEKNTLCIKKGDSKRELAEPVACARAVLRRHARVSGNPAWP